MDLEKKFTSTGVKLLKHLDRLQEFQEGKPVRPITLHIMPESRCNLRCAFCSVVKRPTNERLDFELVVKTVTDLHARGLQGVILSGGGEPMLYPQFDGLLSLLFSLGLKVGLITNGTCFKRSDPSLLKQLSWVRISINVLDYVEEEKLHIPQFGPETVFGLSYIVSPDMTEKSFEKILRFVDEHSPKYIRVTADCMLRRGELEVEHQRVRELVAGLNDERFFHQYKNHGTPSKCYLGYFHPILYCDGYVYPCDSLVLNDTNQEFSKKWRLCRVEDIVDTLYKGNAFTSLVDTKKLCDACVWEGQNEFLCSVVDQDLTHWEFI